MTVVRKFFPSEKLKVLVLVLQETDDGLECLMLKDFCELLAVVVEVLVPLKVFDEIRHSSVSDDLASDDAKFRVFEQKENVCSFSDFHGSDFLPKPFPNTA